MTLACFQGRHEVVSLLVDRRANIEHRAKTGLTPLMEAASGGYAEVCKAITHMTASISRGQCIYLFWLLFFYMQVGRVLLQKGADVNAAPVPSSRDTALTIAADKGHYRFCDLLLKQLSNLLKKSCDVVTDFTKMFSAVIYKYFCRWIAC